MAIKDQQQFKDMDNLLRGMKYLKFLFPKKSRHQLAEVEKEYKRLRDLPDQFNGIFLPRGWVFNGIMSTEVAEEAVRLAKAEGVEKGEQYLEDYYNEDSDFMFMRFFAELQQNPKIKAALKRRQLIEKAIDYHEDGDKYEASVLIVATQIDGIILDMTGKSFYEGKDKNLKHLQAYETLAGDPSALPELAKIMSKVRKASSGEEIDVLYRQGAFHGRDLGYDNRRVSTKTYATLLSLTEVMEAIRKDKQYEIPKPEFPVPETWEDVKALIKDTLEMVKEYQQENRTGE